jgi:DNA-binding CsgD family transcriptional regulator
LSPSVVGREHELARLRDFLEVESGDRTLMLTGSPGVGKTTLWEVGVKAAQERGVRVLATRPSSAEMQLPFTGLIDLLDGVNLDELDELPSPQFRALAVVLLRAEPVGTPPEPQAIRVGFRNGLRVLADDRPVLIAVDDADWLDSASAEALAFAARRIEGERVRFLMTRRHSNSARVDWTLDDTQTERLELASFSIGAARSLIHERLGLDLPRQLLRRIVEAALGNPLFILEAARALGPAPSLEPSAPLRVPESLRELVAGRVADLAPQGRRALLAAASLSHPTHELVEAASSEAGLAAAEEAGLLRTEEGRLAFAHPLYASAVYASAPESRRRSLHARLASLVPEPEERVRQLAFAADGADEAVARALEAAAERARARGGWESAGDLLEQARSLTPLERWELAQERTLRAAEYHLHAGDRVRASALLDEVLAASPPSSTRSEALRLLAEIRYSENSFAEAARLLEEALAQVGDLAHSVTIELNLSYVRFGHLGDSASADLHAERGLEQATFLDDRALLGAALGVRAMVDHLRGRGVEWSKVERALALEDDAVPIAFPLRPSTIAALLDLYVGRLPEARERLTALRAGLVEVGDEADLAFVLSWSTWLEALSGAFATAASLADDAVACAVLSRSETNRGWALAQRALVHAHRGDEGAARADAAEATEIAHRVGHRPPLLWIAKALGLLELSLGDADATWAAVAPSAEAVESEGIREMLGAYALPEGVEALIGLGRLGRAGRLLDRFESRARELDRAWSLVAAGRCRGLLLAARGDLGGASDALERALLEHQRIELPFELARTLLVQGQVLRRRREKRAPRETLERALALFEQLGAPLWADRARSELARIGGRRPTPASQLTPTERRIVQLVADGLSNKEIAGTLFVAVNTVERHLSHAYAKLGVRSRTQLARRLPA